MFEFHGWATVRYHTYGCEEAPQAECWDRVLSRIEGLVAPKELITTRRHNGVDWVSWNGQHNHRSEWAFELLRLIGEEGPGSYGLLYVLNDEDSRADCDNQFRVWVLRRGQVHEEADTFLSPFMPSCADDEDPSRD